jgi:TPR repeat protein
MGALVGCGQLGNTPSSDPLPDVHRKPTREEVAANPCRHGDLPACITLCKNDDPHACNAVGVMFEFDAQGNDDPALASGFYKRGCDSAYAPACNNLAWLYLGGHGVPQDHAQAWRLFAFAYDAAKVACMRGDPASCLMAGELLFDGRGVEPDEQQAVAYFRRACDGGEKRACGRAIEPEPAPSPATNTESLSTYKAAY